MSSGIVAPRPPDVAGAVFGDSLGPATLFADLLCTEGVVRGLIGPREPERIWTRHLLNCGVLASLFEPSTRLIDVGSGAGLPGIVLALVRPDLQVDLLEPLQRRIDFLELAIDALDLGPRVRAVRGRAQDPAIVADIGNAPWVVARAVAPLDRLAGWCLPLAGPAGRLALVKGASAQAEVAEHRDAVRRSGGRDLQIVVCGSGLLDPAVTVVTMTAAPRKATK